MQALSHTSSLAAGATGRAGGLRRASVRAVPRSEQPQDVPSSVQSMVAGALSAPLLLLVSPLHCSPVTQPVAQLAAWRAPCIHISPFTR